MQVILNVQSIILLSTIVHLLLDIKKNVFRRVRLTSRRPLRRLLCWGVGGETVAPNSTRSAPGRKVVRDFFKLYYGNPGFS